MRSLTLVPSSYEPHEIFGEICEIAAAEVVSHRGAGAPGIEASRAAAFDDGEETKMAPAFGLAGHPHSCIL
jgi:hypothetical protein